MKITTAVSRLLTLINTRSLKETRLWRTFVNLYLTQATSEAWWATAVEWGTVSHTQSAILARGRFARIDIWKRNCSLGGNNGYVKGLIEKQINYFLLFSKMKNRCIVCTGKLTLFAKLVLRNKLLLVCGYFLFIRVRLRHVSAIHLNVRCDSV